MPKSSGGEPKVEPTLTIQQRVFMHALQDAIAEHQGPVCVDEIREELGKSDSRVRSHIKALMAIGFVCCVGRSKVKRYVPSTLWFKDPEAAPSLAELERSSVGGICGNHGCTNQAEDLWKGRYLCRRCIIGCDEEEDMRRLRKRWEKDLTAGSPGEMLETALGDPKEK